MHDIDLLKIREQIQEDIIAYMDGTSQYIIDDLCDIVVSNFPTKMKISDEDFIKQTIQLKPGESTDICTIGYSISMTESHYLVTYHCSSGCGTESKFLLEETDPEYLANEILKWT